MTTIEPRKAIRHLQGVHPASEARAGKVRLDMNENTLGAAPPAARGLRRAVEGKWLARYPEYEEARSALAAHFRVSPHELLLTNGIDDGIKLICDTFVDPGDRLLIPALTFPMYQFFHSIAGGETRVVHHDSRLRLPLNRVLAALRRRPVRWLALANPNNPTGTLIPREDLRAILRAAPRTLVLVDEAYFDFSEETVLPCIRKFPNLIVARTFSKAHGLAGLRLGLLFTGQRLARWMRCAQPVFPVNSMALAGAIEAIRNPGYVRRYTRQVIENHAQLCRCLDTLGVPYIPGAANFLFASFGRRAPEIAGRLADQRILVRHWSGDPRLRPYFRMTIGTASETRRLIRALRGLRHLIEPQDAGVAWQGVMQYSPLPQRR